MGCLSGVASNKCDILGPPKQCIINKRMRRRRRRRKRRRRSYYHYYSDYYYSQYAQTLRSSAIREVRRFLESGRTDEAHDSDLTEAYRQSYWAVRLGTVTPPDISSYT